MFQGNRRRYPATQHQDNGKVKQYIHSPFMVEHTDNIKAECDKDGKLTITVQASNDEYDQVIVPASLIFRLAAMLTNSRRVRWVTPEELREAVGDNNAGSEAEDK